MKKSKFSEEQIATALRQIDAGAPVLAVTRKLGISEATYYVWRKRYGQMAIAEIGDCGSRGREQQTRARGRSHLEVILQEVLAKLKPMRKTRWWPAPPPAWCGERGLLRLNRASGIPPSWAGRYRASPALRSGPARPRFAISACMSCCAAKGGESQAGAPDLPEKGKTVRLARRKRATGVCQRARASE
jgi:putative transposase